MNQSLTRDSVQIFEHAGDHFDVEVCFTPRVPSGMALVTGAVVHDFEFHRIESRLISL